MEDCIVAGWAGVLGLGTGERVLYSNRSPQSAIYSVLSRTFPVGCVECATCFVFEDRGGLQEGSIIAQT